MPEETPDKTEVFGEKPDSWWYKVYAVVAIVTVIVIAALSLFTSYFSH